MGKTITDFGFHNRSTEEGRSMEKDNNRSLTEKNSDVNAKFTSAATDDLAKKQQSDLRRNLNSDQNK